MDTIKCLVDLGAKIDAVNKQNHGVVELSAFKQFIDVLEYFIRMADDRLPVWQNLVKFYGSDVDEEAESAAKCLKLMSQPDTVMNPNWESMYQHGVMAKVTKVIQGNLSHGAKTETFYLLLNLLPELKIREQFVQNGGIEATVKLLKVNNNTVVTLAARVIKELVVYEEKDYADMCIANDIIPAVVHVLKTNREAEVLVEVIMVLSNLAEGRAQHQSALARATGTFTALVALYKNCNSKAVLLALTHAIATICRDHPDNQNLMIQENIASNLISLTMLKFKDVQLKAVQAIQALAHNNNKTQQTLKEEGAIRPLMSLLKKSRQTDLQEQTARALWTLAGEDNEEQGKMANEIGVQQLIEFLASLSEHLHYIGSEGLGVLAQGPVSKESEIAQANGVNPLVRLLRSDKEHIVLSVVRTLRHLCVGVGYTIHRHNQATIAQSRGTKFLVAMMAHSKNELIQVEAAHTLGCVALGKSFYS